MEIRDEQMGAFERSSIDEFVAKLQEALRRDAPKMSAKFDDATLHQFCQQCTNWAIEHGLEKQRHLAQIALCFMKMEVDFVVSKPPLWVSQPRDQGQMADDDAWLEYIRNGSRAQLSAD